MAATITPCTPSKNECPVEGHPFLPNNKDGLLLSHQPRCQAEQHGIGESVNLDSMAIEKV